MATKYGLNEEISSESAKSQLKILLLWIYALSLPRIIAKYNEYEDNK